MKSCSLVLVVAGLITIIAASSYADVLSLDCHFGGNYITSYEFTWDFNYESHQLNTHETLLELRPDSYWHLDIFGWVDSDTTFSVVRNITNNTGITWTGYRIHRGPPPAGPTTCATIVKDSIESSRFETITYPDLENYWYWFSGAPFVPDGDSFTMRFDLHVEYVPLYEGSYMTCWTSVKPIPEPATVLLLGLGCAFLRWKRQGA
jgi:hypothetical protein